MNDLTTILKNDIFAVERNVFGNNASTVNLYCYNKKAIRMNLHEITWVRSDTDEFEIVMMENTQGAIIHITIKGSDDDLKAFARAIQVESNIFNN